MGPVEKAVRDDIEQLGDLVGVEPSLSEMAYRLAREIDGLPGQRCDECGTAPADKCIRPGHDSAGASRGVRELRPPGRRKCVRQDDPLCSFAWPTSQSRTRSPRFGCCRWANDATRSASASALETRRQRADAAEAAIARVRMLHSGPRIQFWIEPQPSFQMLFHRALTLTTYVCVSPLTDQ